MKVKDVMTSAVVTCSPEDSISDVARLMKKYSVSGIPVVEGGKLVGLVSESDLLKLLKVPEGSRNLWLPSPFELIELPIRGVLEWEKLREFLDGIEMKKAGDIMVKKVYSVSSDDAIETAADVMVRHRINRLPVVDAGRLVGIVAREDIVRGISRENKA
ncbi:MAG TPA: CBS domain-containing protein [Candidatus Methanoperedenaceae archaeon]|nr:CBS domain-containing protein [Candidatus Methanoperedenaceae archaeon]